MSTATLTRSAENPNDTTREQTCRSRTDKIRGDVAIPLQFIVLLFAGWINRRQLQAIEYLTQENRILKQPLLILW